MSEEYQITYVLSRLPDYVPVVDDEGIPTGKYEMDTDDEGYYIYSKYPFNDEDVQVTCHNPRVYTEYSNITLRNPVRTGYTFNYWYLENPDKFDENGKPEQFRISKVNKANVERFMATTESFANSTGLIDLVIYASWDPKEFTITYDANGGTGTMNTSKSVYDVSYGRAFSKVNIRSNGFTRPGYTFDHWNTRADDKGIYIPPKVCGGYNRNIFTTNTNTVLYAIWKPNRYYNIDYDLGDVKYGINGKYENTVAIYNPISYSIADSVTLISPNYYGFKFVNWYTNKALTDVASVPQIPAGSTGNKKFYAKFTPVKYNIKFDGNGSTSGSMSNITNIQYGVSINLSENVYKRTGYEFNGWNTASNGKGKSYKDMAEVSNLSYKDGATVTLYAQWVVTRYDIHFDSNGTDTSGEMSDYTKLEYGKTYTLPDNKFSRSGYTFKNWCTTKTGTESTAKFFNNKAEVRNLNDGDPKNTVINLYAQWQNS